MDIVILGGGIVGLTIANILAQNSNLNITLVDANKPVLQWDNSQYDLRCSAIAAASSEVFTSIGVWQDIINDRVGCYDQMLVWDQEPDIKVHFAASEIGAANLGHIVENRVILRALHNKLLQCSNVEFIYGLAESVDFNAEKVNLRVAGRQIDCKLIIGADGANSWLRRCANIDVVGWDYNHSALVATIQSEIAHNNTARQRFMNDGPLAFLPLDVNNLSSIVWSSSPEKIASLMQLDSTQFNQQLSEQFANILGELKVIGERKSFPLRMLHAEKYVAARLALVGDSAHVIHPLAGQGLNLGIRDAAVLANILQQACLDGQDIGKLAILRKYERSRKGHNISMLALIEVIKRVFTIKNSTFTNLRFGGIRCINRISFIKNTMMKFAIGV